MPQNCHSVDTSKPLTVGSVLTTNVSQISLCQLLFRATLKVSMFVTTLGMDNFDCTKFHSLSMRGAHSQVKASITSPTPAPYLAKQLMTLSTHKHSSASLMQCSTSTLGLAYNRKTWAYPMNTVLATVAFLLLLDTSLLSQGGITHYSQQLTLQHSTKLLFVCVFFYLFIFLSRSKLIFKVPTTT